MWVVSRTYERLSSRRDSIQRVIAHLTPLLPIHAVVASLDELHMTNTVLTDMMENEKVKKGKS